MNDGTKNKGGQKRSFDKPGDITDGFIKYAKKCEKEDKVLTKGGFAIFMDVSFETLSQYRQGTYDTKEDKLSEALKKVYDIIEEMWVQQLKGNKVVGSIFYLKNAFSKNWRDRREFDHTSKDKPIPILNLNVLPNDSDTENNETEEKD